MTVESGKDRPPVRIGPLVTCLVSGPLAVIAAFATTNPGLFMSSQARVEVPVGAETFSLDRDDVQYVLAAVTTLLTVLFYAARRNLH